MKGTKNKPYEDEWTKICLRCPLPDCVVKNGVNDGKNHDGCIIWEAQLREWTPDETLDNAGEMGLLEPVQWVDL